MTELTDATINHILYLHSKKFKPQQIKLLTDVPTSTIKRICRSKLVKKKVYKYKFDWSDFNYSVI
jgi:hypothetical protein